MGHGCRRLADHRIAHILCGVGDRTSRSHATRSSGASGADQACLKIPFLQQLTFFEDRLLDYDAAPAPVITRDKKNLVVDNYAKWQIRDPLKFLQTVQNEAGAQARLDDIIYSKVREQLGLHDLVEVIATKRDPIMRAVTAGSHEAATAYGIGVIDVRIKRADLPPENAQAVYGRMRTEQARG